MSLDRAPKGFIMSNTRVRERLSGEAMMSANRAPTGRVFKTRIFVVQNFHDNVRTGYIQYAYYAQMS